LEQDVPHVAVRGGKSVQETPAYTGREPFLESESAAQQMDDLLSRHRASFFRSAYRFLENAADAEDAVQDALLCAYRHIHQFRGEAQMSTWLTAIVFNSARMQLRRRPRQTHVSLDGPIGEEQEHSISMQLQDHRPSPEEECRNSELQARLRELVPRLSPPLRKAFQLRDLDGLTTSEAAQILGVAEGTVKAQLARARTKLKVWMRRALKPRRSVRRGGTTLPSTTKK
jgi:RNA polymerase sigma-70 factor (ECF subfamily)